jgi:hypothetical protein
LEQVELETERTGNRENLGRRELREERTGGRKKWGQRKLGTGRTGDRENDGPFVPHIISNEPCSFTKVPDGRQEVDITLWLTRQQGNVSTHDTDVYTADRKRFALYSARHTTIPCHIPCYNLMQFTDGFVTALDIVFALRGL